MVKSLRTEVKEKQTEINKLSEQFDSLQKEYTRLNEQYYADVHNRGKIPNRPPTAPYDFDKAEKYIRWDEVQKDTSEQSWPTIIKPRNKWQTTANEDVLTYEEAIRKLMTIEESKEIKRNEKATENATESFKEVGS